MSNILQGHVLDILPTLPADSVDCVVTSPPYWGLRDYKIEPQIWDEPEAEDDIGYELWAKNQNKYGCEHEWQTEKVWLANSSSGSPGKQQTNAGTLGVGTERYGTQTFCLRCGAWRGSLGLEPTPELFVKHIVEVFREVRRVLKPTGVCFVNLGDSYAHGQPGAGSVFDNGRTDGRKSYDADKARGREKLSTLVPGLKPKDLCGIPWRVAFALQADGWWLRQDIVWAKGISGEIRAGSVMPESVKDRCCKSHEYVFLLTKSQRYFWNQNAIQEDCIADENMQQVSQGITSGDVLQEQPTEGRQIGLLCGVHEAAKKSLGQEVQQNRESKSECEAVLLFGEGAEKQSSISPSVCDDRGTKGEVQTSQQASCKRGQIQAANQAILQNREGQKDKGEKGCSVHQNREREILEKENGNQTKISNSDNGLQIDSEGMEGNQESVSEPLCLLQSSVSEIRNGSCDSSLQRGGAHEGKRSSSLPNLQRQKKQPSKGNSRSVWFINPEPTKEAHFATFPQELVKRCILAGCPEGGTVLDPFMGSGTTGIVAENLYRKWIGIELNPEYIKIAKKRLKTKANIDQVN